MERGTSRAHLIGIVRIEALGSRERDDAQAIFDSDRQCLVLGHRLRELRLQPVQIGRALREDDVDNKNSSTKLQFRMAWRDFCNVPK